MNETKNSKKEEEEPLFTLKQVEALLARQRVNDEFIYILKEYVKEEGEKMRDPEDALRIMTNVSAMVMMFITMNTILNIAAKHSKGR